MGVEDEMNANEAGQMPGYGRMAQNGGEPGASKEAPNALKKRFFNPVKEFFGPPHNWFDDPAFYKTVLSGEGEVAERLHKNLADFLKAKDPADRSIYKARLPGLFWQLHKQIMPKAVSPNCPMPKRLFARYGALLPNLISSSHKKAMSEIFWQNRLGETVWYCDEWVKMVAEGKANRLATDEEPIQRAGGDTAALAKLRAQQDKVSGSREGLAGLLHNLDSERASLSASIVSRVRLLMEKQPSRFLPNFLEPFNDAQKHALSELPNLAKALASLMKNTEQSYNKFKHANEELENIGNNIRRLGGKAAAIDTDAASQEDDQIAKLAHICIGRQGNNFPLLAGQYFSDNLKFVATRENVVQIMSEVEAIDVRIFRREFRRQVNRVPPHVILIPCYGNYGACWEPYERRNKSTSRGRIAVPLFPADVRLAVIWALGDLRWQQAKEMAAHYWMEEGITGQYYQWFSEQKMRGDVRLSFIEDYVLWITKESEGTQKMEREVRGIFWRNMPFSKERRTKLKDRGFVYDQLYKNDLNRYSEGGDEDEDYFKAR